MIYCCVYRVIVRVTERLEKEVWRNYCENHSFLNIVKEKFMIFW